MLWVLGLGENSSQPQSRCCVRGHWVAVPGYTLPLIQLLTEDLVLGFSGSKSPTEEVMLGDPQNRCGSSSSCCGGIFPLDGELQGQREGDPMAFRGTCSPIVRGGHCGMVAPPS